MRITSLHLAEVGPFQNVKFSFPPEDLPENAEIHILTGQNGSGKSTVLYALASVFGQKDFVRKRFWEKGPEGVLVEARTDFIPKRIRKKGAGGLKEEVITEPSDRSQGEDVFTFSNHEFPTGVPDGLDRYWFLSQPAKYQTGGLGIHGLSQTLDFAAFGYSGSRDLRSPKLETPKEPEDRPLETALDFGSNTDVNTIASWVALNFAKSAFATQQNDHDKSSHYRQRIARIEEAVSKILGEPVQFSFEYEPLKVALELRGRSLDLGVAPDGVKSVLSWIADILMRIERVDWTDKSIAPIDQPLLIFLDEIEIHLHPKWQRRILPAVQKLFPNAQIFVATHSPFVIGSVDDAWVHQLEFDRAGMAIAKPPEKANDAISFVTILQEYFDIDEYFGTETEQKLNEFYQLRNSVLRGEKNVDQLRHKARELGGDSVELQAVVGRELRQVEHRMKQAS